MERFWSKVEKTDFCWEWKAARLRRTNGQISYGIIGWNGKSTNAHRVAWELTHGPIPEGKWVLHKCDNQGCVNPDHLYLGTHTDNTHDAIRRRRMWSGTQLSRLRPVDVAAIKALIAAGFSTEKIGPLFGITGRAVRYIGAGKNWRYE